MIDSPLTMNPEIKRLELGHLIVLTDVVFSRSKFHLLISKKSDFSDCLSRIDHFLKEMIEDGTIDRLYEEYFSIE